MSTPTTAEMVGAALVQLRELVADLEADNPELATALDRVADLLATA